MHERYIAGMNNPQMLSGRVRIRQAIGQSGAVLRVKLENVSNIDAAAILVAETNLPIAQPLAAGSELSFEILVPALDERERYNVRAHIDLTGSGDVTAGDSISTKAYPVLTQNYPNDVTIEVNKV